jgi:hypothetical protein
MEKISERSAKMLDDRKVFGEGPVYLTTHLIVTSLERQLRKQIRHHHIQRSHWSGKENLQAYT